MSKVLIIDDNRQICEMLAETLSKDDVTVSFQLTLKQGLDQLFSEQIDVIFLDINLPDGNGLGAINRINSHPNQPEIIIITGYKDQDGAETAIKSGVWDYIPKGGSPKEFQLSLERALKYRRQKQERGLENKLNRTEIIGESPAIKSSLTKIFKAAQTDVPVLVSGETGTGKELFGKAIHKNSSRLRENFIIVDCAALSEDLAESMLFGHTKGAFTSADSDKTGLVRLAHQGTLFLDEVGELSLSLQKKFLRVLQEKKFRPIGGKKEIESDFRLVSATHRDLKEMVDNGDFREDFYFRISVIKINIPPLRQRKTDIPLLIQNILKQHGTPEQGINYEASTAFMKEFLMYDWPGNVRELISAVAYACADCYGGGQLVPMHLPDQIRTANINKKIITDDGPDLSAGEKSEQICFDQVPLKAFIEEMKEKYLTQLLLHTQGNIQEACRLSGLSRGHLYSLLKKYKKTVV